MFTLLLMGFVNFIAFPESKDSILEAQSKENSKSVVVEASGSLGLLKNGKCVKTYPNETLISDEKIEWCSNIVPQEQKPWIQYSINDKQMKVKKFSIRNGCCRYVCCCDDTGKVIDGYCCCYMYSYSLHASNDNKTWKAIYKVEKDNSFYSCLTKTFELEKETEPFTYFRLVLDEEYPNCKRCMQVNQIEFYGKVVNRGITSYSDNEDDESISIIGRVRNE